MPIYGQIVVGPPGSGKTTYCYGLSQFFSAVGRKSAIFNMDPANHAVPYKPDADLSELVCASKVASELSLGPNASLMYCMEYLANHLHWLHAKLKQFKDHYILFDFPGQIELYTHNDCIRKVVQAVLRDGHRITAVNLVDSHYCSDPVKFIAVMLTSVTIMLQLELPAVNVLSKIDLIEQFGTLSQDLQFFTENGDLRMLLADIHEDPLAMKHVKLNEALIQLVEDFPFVAYQTLDIQNKESVARLLAIVDKSNGYVYANIDASKLAYQTIIGKPQHDTAWTLEVQERYMKR